VNTDRERRDRFRARTEWRGTYVPLRADAEPAGAACWAIDVSATGIAIEIHGPDLDIGEHVLLRLEPNDRLAEDGLQLRACVRNRRESSTGRIFGLSFEGMVPAQAEAMARVVAAAERLTLARRA
jgi:c-di-GMP-binding flagellar brake protein YcgR